jgi:Carbamoyl-phosphate synthase L chain, ATP binding domain
MSLVTGTPRVLILALANWFGAPRLPSAFRRAGFHVTTFGFSGLLIQRSQAVDEAIMLPESVSNDELLAALLAAVDRSGADIVIPTDDTTIVALHAAVALARRPGVSERTRAVLATSLGDLRHLPTVRSRKLLADLAASVAVRAPAYGVVFSEADALGFAAAHGYPIVLKEEDSAAGWGVFICKDEAELKAAVLRSSQNPAIFGAGLLAQTFVEGRTAMRVVVAQQGRVLGGLSAIKLETWPNSKGPSTCVELIDHPEMKASAEALVAALGYSGFASLDFMLDGNGRAHLIELNPRPTPISHLGERFGGCLCRHLHAALTGLPTTATEPQGLPSRVALFPQEWVRDQKSPHLAAGVFHDAPWDEPDLVEAYTAFGRGQMRFAAYRASSYRNEDLRGKLAELEKGA